MLLVHVYSNGSKIAFNYDLANHKVECSTECNCSKLCSRKMGLYCNTIFNDLKNAITGLYNSDIEDLSSRLSSIEIKEVEK